MWGAARCVCRRGWGAFPLLWYLCVQEVRQFQVRFYLMATGWLLRFGTLNSLSCPGVTFSPSPYSDVSVGFRTQWSVAAVLLLRASAENTCRSCRECCLHASTVCVFFMILADVKMKTNRSHAQEYGDLSIAKEPVGDFQGNVPSARNVYYPEIVVSVLQPCSIHTLQSQYSPIITVCR